MIGTSLASIVRSATTRNILRQNSSLIRNWKVEGEAAAFMAYGRDDFESIVRSHQAMVYSIAYHFFRNEHLAEEVAQDVFLQLYEQLATIESPSHLTAWL